MRYSSVRFKSDFGICNRKLRHNHGLIQDVSLIKGIHIISLVLFKFNNEMMKNLAQV